MRLCGYYDEDGDDGGICARDPWKCTFFRKRFRCPWMEKWDQKKYEQWKAWKHRQILMRKIFGETWLGLYIRIIGFVLFIGFLATILQQ